MRPAGQLPLWLRHGTALVLLANLAVMVAAFELAFALRFDFALPAGYVAVMLRLLPFALLCKLVSFAALGLFRGWWRHVSLRDAEDLVRGNVLGSTLFLVAVVFVHGLAGFPRSIFILDPVLCLVLQAALRLTIPLLQARRARAGARGVQKLMLIVGAGSAGIHLLQEIESRRELGIGVVGFVDDDPAKQGFRVCGAPVLGTVDELPALVVQHVVGEVLIAIPSASGARLRRIIERCDEVRVHHRVLPTVGELALGSVTYSRTREVKVDDFLAREPARFDLLRVRTLLADERVLVTGAAG